MQTLILITGLLVLSSIGYALGRNRAFAVSDGHSRVLHSRPGYHGMFVALWCALPALILVVIWSVLEPQVAEWVLVVNLPATAKSLSPEELSLLIVDVKNLATGNIVSREIDPALQSAADSYARLRVIGMPTNQNFFKQFHWREISCTDIIV